MDDNINQRELFARSSNELAEEIAEVTTWPQMARQYARAIATVKHLERAIAVVTAERDALRRRVALEVQAPAA